MRRLRLLLPLIAVFLLAVPVPTASATVRKQGRDRPPTLLWLAFPLEQRPDASSRRTFSREAIGSSIDSSGQFRRPLVYLLVGFLVSAGIAVSLLMLLWTQLATSGRRRRTVASQWHGNRLALAPLGHHLRHTWTRERSWFHRGHRLRRREVTAAAPAAIEPPREGKPEARPSAEPRPATPHASLPPATPAREAIMERLRAKPVSQQESGHEHELEQEPDDMLEALLAAERAAIIRFGHEQELKLAAREKAVADREQELQARTAKLEAVRTELEKRELELAREREKEELALGAERRRLGEQANEALERERSRLRDAGKKLEERLRDLAAKEKALQAKLDGIELERRRELAAGRKQLAAERKKLEAEHARRVQALAAKRAKLEAEQVSVDQKRAELQTLRPKRTSETKREPKKAATRRPRAQPARAKEQAPSAPQQAVAPSREERSRAVGKEVCQIALWRGYVKWHFYTSQLGTYRLPTAVASDPFLRLRDEKTPTPAAEQALAGLINELKGSGWAVVANGPRWYDYRLERA